MFGIKLYKLCVEKVYSNNLTVYCGQDKVEGLQSGNKGRTIYTDNYYTSISLAHSLLEKETYLVETLRANRKFNPKDIIQKQLKKGKKLAAESNTGIVIQKWKDQRDVLTLNTKHTSELLQVTSGRKQTEKPFTVVNCNNHKAFIDVSDQMKEYGTTLRQGVKWYRKLALTSY
ncbi:uncharacterized protein [Diabrotica undecimpunctata]|uniref:uncharacterized protein n=1 Tax=Diabrotica undecimpunctata TaxID=50387 RepID=UPI003B632A37